jgi:hypothetical protein
VLNGPPREILSQVEVLARYRTRPPQVTALAYALDQRGLKLPEFPVTLEQALQLIPSQAHV